ncbi:MAG: hypothetical protein ABIS21_06290 [Acidimicrobiales bacterium]
MATTPDFSWERRHPAARESWSFDFCTPDAGFGGFVSLTLHPPPRPAAWYWAGLVGAGRPYLLVRDLDIDAPRRAGSREVRADGLWADINCETPFEHWSLGLEAFGVAMDDPDEALGAERGDRTGVGLDLEWEAVAGIVGNEGDYDQPCDVHGEILVGAGSVVETIAFEGHGWRRHAWGSAAVRGAGDWLGGRLDDGAPCRLNEAVVQLPRRVQFRAPLRLESGVLERSLCRFTGPGGSAGAGWHERVIPQSAAST